MDSLGAKVPPHVWASAVATGLFFCALLLLRSRRAQKAKREGALGPFSVPLNDVEQDLAKMCTGIGIAYLYSGTPPVEQLRERVSAIVKANPWLAGCLINRWLGGYIGRAALWVPQVPDSAPHFVVCHDEELTEAMPRQSLFWHLRRHRAVENFSHFLPLRPGRLWSVTLLIGKDETFAIVVTMNHAVGDVKTFYDVLSMLDSSREVQGLNPRRDIQLSREIGAMFRKSAFEDGLIVSLRYAFRMFFMKRHVQLFRIDTPWVEEQKEKCKKLADVPFLSSNDIITSAIMKLGGVGLGLLVMNGRRFAPKDAEGLLGNFLFFPPMLPEDFKTPIAVRQFLTSSCRDCMPLPWRTALQGRVFVVSNWTSLQQSLAYEGCECLTCIPLFPDHPEYAIVFRDPQSQMNVAVTATPDVHAAIAAHPAFRVIA